MIPKEKANELGNRFYDGSVFDYDKEEHILEREKAKKRATIAVDEIIEQWEYIDTYLADMNKGLNPNLNYWKNVKLEIEKL
jgi:tetrahydromethanopterin S-methyltransferase subunit B